MSLPSAKTSDYLHDKLTNYESLTEPAGVPMSVEVSRTGHAGVVTMRWPEKRNALGSDDAREVADAIAVAADQDVGVVILTGEGAFCSGGDLEAFADLSERLSPEQIRSHVYGHVQAMARSLRDCPVPTVAAVDGPAIGLGFDLALACDMRFVGPHGWLQQGWARAGLIAGLGGVALLRRFGPDALWSLVANQQRIDGREAARRGFAEVGEPTGFAAALARGEALAAYHRDVLEAYVRLQRPLWWPPEHHFDQAADMQASFIGSERFRAMAEKILAARRSAPG